MSSKIKKIHYVDTFRQSQSENNEVFTIDLNSLDIGYNFTEKYIIYLNSKNTIEWVISRLCDHANGTLQPCKDQTLAICPLHGWRLNLSNLKYENVNVKKSTIEFKINNNELLIEQNTTYLEFPKIIDSNNINTHVQFLAHACLSIESNNIKIITDPWLEGPCFMRGWWHDPRPPENAIEELLSADVIYISHNHPDHMHVETLKFLLSEKSDIPIITANFKTKSSELPLRNMGFKNVHALAFNQIYEFDQTGLYVSIFKSGDFRDDSGLYVNANGKQLLLTVDSSNLNQLTLPKNIDFLATSFTGGASGHPWCFNHYSEDKKAEITENRHISVKKSVKDYIDACSPKAYMPYAGYFSETATRDSYIKEHNKKISVDDITDFIKNDYKNLEIINPRKHDAIEINETIQLSNITSKRKPSYSQEEISNYIKQEHKPDENIFIATCIKYFKNCNYSDDLILYLIPCKDDFIALGSAILVNFSEQTKSLKTFNTATEAELEYEKNNSRLRKLKIKVRYKQLWETIYYKKSWEELSIGFHCRIHRKPDVYNSDFWYHFSNVYVA